LRRTFSICGLPLLIFHQNTRSKTALKWLEPNPQGPEAL